MSWAPWGTSKVNFQFRIRLSLVVSLVPHLLKKKTLKAGFFFLLADAYISFCLFIEELDYFLLKFSNLRKQQL